MARKYHREVISEKPSPDGRGTIIIEKDVKCTGSDCRHCSPGRHSRRPSKLDVNNSPYSTVEERLPTPYEFDFRPDPAAKQRRREKSYRDHGRSHSDGYTLNRSSSTRGASDPIAIPKPTPRRSKTMYEDDLYDKHYSDSARESRSRPSIHQDSAYYRDSRYPPSRSARIPLGFYEVLESSRPGKHSADRRRSASPLDTPQKTDEYDPERRRQRSKSSSKSQPAIVYGASPLLPAFEPSSYGSSPSARRYSMDSTSARSRSASLTAASSPPKSVRWGDDPRLAQNQKISSRHARRDSFSAGTGDTAGVKSILKPSSSSSKMDTLLTPPPSPPAAKSLSADQYDSLYKSAQSIGIDDRPTTPQRQVLQERSAEIEGLRKRISGHGVVDDQRYSPFASQPQRYNGAWGEKASSRGRRSERFYDDTPAPPHRRDSFYY